ncbi:MAG TPA: protoporphyrinogen oxidase [Myxococcota bacterium]|nr:protoporphyrinogen oxidase [Myxococcota bacterium]
MAPEVIVIGGGIAGLACATKLKAAGIDVLVLEKEDLPGGNVRTEMVAGFKIERGPHTFMPSADDIFDLVKMAGLESQLLPSRPTAKKRFIVRGGKMHMVFSGPGSFVTSRLLSLRGKLKLMGEPFRTRRRGQPGETASRFFERRFGPEAARVLAGAFISGVYAGDPEKLSAADAFPLFWRFEHEAGSMIRGALRLRKQRRVESRRRGESVQQRPRGLLSFREGLGQLTMALAKGLGDHCLTSAPVESISRTQDGFAIESAGGTMIANKIVLAAPPQAAARIVHGLDRPLADELLAVPMAPVAVVQLGFAARAAEVPDGFGFLAPRGEGVRSLGVLFPARLFDGRTPKEGDLLIGFTGGMLDAEAMELDDDALIDIVLEDLRHLCGFGDKPVLARVARYAHAIPQLVVGHAERLERIRTRLETLPGLQLAGNYLLGVGMKDAVASGFAAARSVLGQESAEQGARS